MADRRPDYEMLWELSEIDLLWIFALPVEFGHAAAMHLGELPSVVLVAEFALPVFFAPPLINGDACIHRHISDSLSVGRAPKRAMPIDHPFGEYAEFLIGFSSKNCF